MKYLFWFLGLLVFAVVVGVAGKFNTGYVQIVYAPYRVEMSLSFAIVSATLGFFALYAVLRLTAAALGLPAQVRAYRLRRTRNRARGSLYQAMNAYFEGSYARAEKLAASALKLRESPGVSAVIAARSAHELGRFDQRDAYLETAEHAGPEADLLRLVTQAELLLEERDSTQALQVLRVLRERAPKNVHAMRLELKSQVQARNWDQVLAILGLLRRADAIDTVSAEQIRLNAYEENLRLMTHDRRAFLDYWARIPSSDRAALRLAVAGAGHMVDLGLHDEARALIERAVDREWQTELVALYGEAIGTNRLGQIETAERWLVDHPTDASLLLALGKLCAREGLWGKARSYLEASIAVEPSREAHAALAQLLESIGKPEEALRYNRRAMEHDDRGGSPLMP